MKLANRINVTGEVAEVKMIQAMYHESVNNDYYVISIQSIVGTVHNFTVSGERFDGFGYSSVLFVGNVITATFEECIAGETYYLTEDGDKVEHEEDHLYLVDVISTTKIVMVKEGIPLELANEIVASRTTIAPVVTPKFYAKKSNDTSEERITALTERWHQTTGIVKDNILYTLNALGYYLDDDQEHFVRK